MVNARFQGDGTRAVLRLPGAAEIGLLLDQLVKRTRITQKTRTRSGTRIGMYSSGE
jgi:hypothetical protein